MEEDETSIECGERFLTLPFLRTLWYYFPSENEQVQPPIGVRGDNVPRIGTVATVKQSMNLRKGALSVFRTAIKKKNSITTRNSVCVGRWCVNESTQQRNQ